MASYDAGFSRSAGAARTNRSRTTSDFETWRVRDFCFDLRDESLGQTDSQGFHSDNVIQTCHARNTWLDAGGASAGLILDRPSPRGLRGVAMSEPPRPTIFALSSGRPPAAIAVVRISGPRAGEALKALTGKRPLPRARRPSSRLRDPQTKRSSTRRWRCGFPAPRSETGEDVAELQLHGGRAVIAATLAALGKHRGPAPGRGGRVHPPRLRERQARSYRGGRPRRPGDGRDGRPAPRRRCARCRARSARARRTGANG